MEEILHSESGFRLAGQEILSPFMKPESLLLFIIYPSHMNSGLTCCISILILSRCVILSVPRDPFHSVFSDKNIIRIYLFVVN